MAAQNITTTNSSTNNQVGGVHSSRMDRYPHIPGLPKDYDELMECLDESEAEFEEGKSIPWEIAKTEAKIRIHDYAL